MTLELGRVTDRKPPFKYSALARVGFSDTDAQGIVYYGRYMPYFDLARVEYTRHLGLVISHAAEHQFVMRAASVEYHAPALFDDLLEIFVRTRRVGTTSLTTAFAAYRIEDDTLMCMSEQTLVYVDLAVGRPRTIPDSIRGPLHAFESEDLEEASR